MDQRTRDIIYALLLGAVIVTIVLLVCNLWAMQSCQKALAYINQNGGLHTCEVCNILQQGGIIQKTTTTGTTIPPK